MKKSIILPIFLFLFSLSVFSENQSNSPASPLHIPLLLTGNFGELRPNHFHSGLDFKTQGRTGFPVYSFDDGYVSRVMLAPSGNGKAIYINHPNGLTTVYLHLDRFTPAMEAMVEAFQYKDEQYEVNHYFKENEVKVTKGELIAYSGNSGSSGGPHLHFEVRDTKTEEVFDPIFYFRNLIKDHIAPQAREVAIYPMFYSGLINGKMQRVILPVVNKTLRQTPQVWGKVALGLKAFDSKDGISNVYGVKYVKLFVDKELVYSSDVNRYAFKNTRNINSCIDYPEWRQRRSTIMKSYVEPGNKIGIFDALKNGGIIDIDEERDYKIKYVLIDEYENSSELNFTLRGKRQEIPVVTIDCENKFFWDKQSSFRNSKVHLDIQPGVLYDDLCFNYSSVPSAKYFSDIHTLHTPDVPMQTFCSLEIKVDVDTLKDKSKYCLVKVAGQGVGYLKSEYKKGWVKGSIREFGNYAVAADTKAPVITQLKASSRNEIHLKISEYQSGVATYRGTIDGKFALFEYIPQCGLYLCKLSSKHVTPNSQHELEMVVTDNCGNVGKYESSFFW